MLRSRIKNWKNLNQLWSLCAYRMFNSKSFGLALALMKTVIVAAKSKTDSQSTVLAISSSIPHNSKIYILKQNIITTNYLTQAHMNSSATCHEIEGVPGLYVDAFRGSYLKKTSDTSNSFILTHYHGDHYGSLHRDGKYQGPALIHCTPVTAALLRNVHKVPSQFVVEHDYGIPWTCQIQGNSGSDKHDTVSANATITFYDANHCPGAAIVTIQLQDGTVHLHTGDMRYHPKMKSYPVIRDAVQKRKMDLLYLDTTYGHPKHDFLSQDAAVDSIATQIHDIMSGHDQCCSPSSRDDTQIKNTSNTCNPKVLILLSCYSIGKEKVLWEASTRTNQQVYVTDRKLAMMKCIQTQQPTSDPASERAGATHQDHVLPCNQMVERCTSDPNATDLHVIPMGLAGELWPYFRPNYRQCVDYAEDLHQRYDKVVAFIPTGWADASNWNKKNAISQRQLECRKSERNMDVEIRLISYSEHSTCSELISFVEFCRPRKVIPTVFGDDKDRRRLEKLFRKYVDSSRAKLQFFKGMQVASSKSVPSWAGSSSVSKSKTSMQSDVQPTNVSMGERASEAKPSPQPEAATAKDLGADTNIANNECIDLTFSSDDENGHPEIADNVAPVANGSADCTIEAKSSSARRPAPSPNSGTTTPAKRKRRESSSKEKTATPPITRFFAVKKS